MPETQGLFQVRVLGSLSCAEIEARMLRENFFRYANLSCLKTSSSSWPNVP